MDNEVMQYAEDKNKGNNYPCFAFLTSSMEVDIEMCESMFSNFFDRPVVKYGPTLGCCPKGKFFFRLSDREN